MHAVVIVPINRKSLIVCELCHIRLMFRNLITPCRRVYGDPAFAQFLSFQKRNGSLTRTSKFSTSMERSVNRSPNSPRSMGWVGVKLTGSLQIEQLLAIKIFA